MIKEILGLPAYLKVRYGANGDSNLVCGTIFPLGILFKADKRLKSREGLLIHSTWVLNYWSEVKNMIYAMNCNFIAKMTISMTAIFSFDLKLKKKIEYLKKFRIFSKAF